MSRSLNPDGFHDEIMHFLYCERSDLDIAYSLILQKQAWECAPAATLTDAVLYMLSESVQAELCTLVVGGQKTSSS